MVENNLSDVGGSTARPSTGSPRLTGVQYARAVAALGVLVFHACQRVGVAFPQGARGVDVFFVISGFIMWRLAERNPTPLGFMADRFRRIAPLYWVATLFMVVAGLVGLFPNLRNGLTLEHVLLSMAFVPHVSPSSGHIAPVLVPGWTLNYEMFFYAVFAALLFFGRNARLAGLTLVLLGLPLLGVIFRPTNPVIYTWTDPLVLEFLIGVWMAESVRRGFTLPPWLAAAAIPVGLILLIGWPIDGSVGNRLITAVIAGILVWGVVALDLRGATPLWKPGVFLGDASYSTYLWHGVAVSIAGTVGVKLGLSPVVVVLMAVAGGLIAGAISYLVLEKPLMRLLARKTTKAKQA